MRYRRDRLNRFQRTMGWNAGHGEGWALYAERLMGELGYFEDPAFELGMLRAQAMRAVRVVVDIGLHLELPIPTSEDFRPGETWTPEAALDFVINRSRFPADFMTSEVDRYLGWPGQAICYKVGERVLAARSRRRACAPRSRLRPQGLPHPRPRARLDGTRPARGGAGQDLASRSRRLRRRAARAPQSRPASFSIGSLTVSRDVPDSQPFARVGGLLGGVELLLDDRETAVPELRVGQVDARRPDRAPRACRTRRARAARGTTGRSRRPAPRTAGTPTARAAGRTRRRRRTRASR